PRHRQHAVDLSRPPSDLGRVAAAVERYLTLVERRPHRPQLARRLDDRLLALLLRDAYDRLEDREQAATLGERDEAARHLDALAAPLVVAPDHEQLQRDRRRGNVRRFVERGVLDDSARLLDETVDREDEPVRHERRDRRRMLAVDQETGG